MNGVCFIAILMDSGEVRNFFYMILGFFFHIMRVSKGTENGTSKPRTGAGHSE